jgi:hypothetical protein
MADDTPEGDPPPDTDDLGDSGKKALAAERKARRDAERQLKDMADRLAAIEDAEKTETQRLADKLSEAEARATQAEANALRLQVAQSKGLSAAQAKRLVGSTQEELEADADEILEAFPAQGATPPPDEAPRPDLRGGNDPTGDEPVDVRTVVDSIPR